MGLKLNLLFINLFFTSCSTVHFVSTNDIPISFETNKSHTKKIKFTVDRPFYLWGLLPEKQVVKVDEEFKRRGIDSASEFEIHEANQSKFAWTSLFTLGMYYEKAYNFVAKIK